jgi:hypothetical protein
MPGRTPLAASHFGHDVQCFPINNDETGILEHELLFRGVEKEK